MSDEPEFDDLGEDADPVGDLETRKVQKLGRVDVPDDYLEQIGVDVGNKVMVICEEDQVIITEASKEVAFDNAR